MKKKTETSIDPTLPFTEITLDGATYKMCFDFGAIATVEAELRRAGKPVSLLQSSWELGMLDLQLLFAASLRPFHPDLDFEAAKRLVNWRNVDQIIVKIRQAQANFAPEQDDKADPPQAPSEK